MMKSSKNIIWEQVENRLEKLSKPLEDASPIICRENIEWSKEYLNILVIGNYISKPCLYLTFEGNILAEVSVGEWEVSFEFLYPNLQVHVNAVNIVARRTAPIIVCVNTACSNGSKVGKIK